MQKKLGAKSNWLLGSAAKARYSSDLHAIVTSELRTLKGTWCARHAEGAVKEELRQLKARATEVAARDIATHQQLLTASVLATTEQLSDFGDVAALTAEVISYAKGERYIESLRSLTELPIRREAQRLRVAPLLLDLMLPFMQTEELRLGISREALDALVRDVSSDVVAEACKPIFEELEQEARLKNAAAVTRFMADKLDKLKDSMGLKDVRTHEERLRDKYLALIKPCLAKHVVEPLVAYGVREAAQARFTILSDKEMRKAIKHVARIRRVTKTGVVTDAWVVDHLATLCTDSLLADGSGATAACKMPVIDGAALEQRVTSKVYERALGPVDKFIKRNRPWLRRGNAEGEAKSCCTRFFQRFSGLRVQTQLFLVYQCSALFVSCFLTLMGSGVVWWVKSSFVSQSEQELVLQLVSASQLSVRSPAIVYFPASPLL